MRMTVTQAMLAALACTGALVGGLVWRMLAGWERSIIVGADALQTTVAKRATEIVDDYLGHLKRAVADVERRDTNGACKLPDCLRGSIIADDTLAEASFTSVDGWQLVASRARDGALCTSETRATGTVFVASRRCGALPAQDTPVEDPRKHATFETPAKSPGTLIWSDLAYSALDGDLPERQRRVVVQVIKGVVSADGKLRGVLRVAMIEQQLDEIFAKLRVNQDDATDPFRVFLADTENRLITRWTPADQLHVVDDDLRVANPPPLVTAALASHGTFKLDGRRYRIRSTALDGTQDWRVGVVGPEDYYLAAPRRAQRWMTVIALGVLGAMAIALMLAAAAARRGLLRVVAETERMQKLDFTAAAATTRFRDIEAVLVALERAKTAMRALGKYAPIDLVRSLWASNI